LHLISSNLTFNEHNNSICAKTFRNLGFIKCNCTEFKNLNYLKTLYNALVWSGLEFGSTVWNLRPIGLTDKIENVSSAQYVAHQFNLVGSSISEVENQFNMITLKSKRNFIDAYFIHELLNGFIDGPELL
jgi:hypothetical protein